MDEMKGKTIKLCGYLVEQPDQNENRIKFIISTDSIITYNKSLIVSGNVMISVFKNKFSESIPEKLDYGDYVEVTGNLEQLPHRRNPGEFDYGEYLKLHGTEASFTSFGFEKIKLLSNTTPDYFKKYIIYPIKKYTVQKIDELMGGDEGEFMKGLVLGDRSNLSKEIREDFVNDGISHIISVSGLNVAYIIIILALFLQIFPINNVYKIMITIFALFFYMNLTGNVPSIVRATVMSCTFLISLLVERKSLSLNIISFAALLILLIDPRQLFDAGFILSFWAILSLFLIYPKLESIIKSKQFYLKLQNDSFLNKGIKALIILVLGTLSAQIGTVPITAIMFKKLSVISLITNMVAIPVSNIGMAMGFLLVIVSVFSNWAATAIAVSSSFLLHLLLGFIRFFADLNFSFVETYNLDILFLICFYICVIILLFLPKISIVSKIIFIALIIANYLTINSIITKTDKLKLTYLDVGNSNSVLLFTPENYTVMVNTGSSSAKYSTAENNIIPYLKLQGKNHIDLLIITSLDKDEFRNLITLVKLFPIKYLVIPESYKHLLENNYFVNIFNKIKIDYVSNSKILNNKGDLRFYLYYPDDIKSKFYVIVNYGAERFIFTDFKLPGNENFTFPVEKLNTSILKVPASGSFSLISPEFIAKTDPKNVVISSRSDKRRLNSDVFCKTLEKMGINVYKTSELGAVIFETDGHKTERVIWK